MVKIFNSSQNTLIILQYGYIEPVVLLRPHLLNMWYQRLRLLSILSSLPSRTIVYFLPGVSGI